MIGILGGNGFLGSNLANYLSEKEVNFTIGSRTTNVDATDSKSILRWIHDCGITELVNLAAICGGIGLNKQSPAILWDSTTRITAGVLNAMREVPHVKLVMLGTVCSYAANCPTPFKEEYLMNYGYPEQTNSAYGLAKLSSYFGMLAYKQQYGIRAIYLLPVNMYGPYDHFDPTVSHVIPAIIKKICDAKENGLQIVTCWGTGHASREFLYAKDAAEAIYFACQRYEGNEPINLGTGKEITIKALTELLCHIIGYNGIIEWDTNMPDGQIHRCLDVTKAKTLLGFTAKTELVDGLTKTVEWYAQARRNGVVIQ